MDQISTITELERRALEAGLTVTAMCRQAEIAPITWRRWRAGTSGANFKTLEKITEVIARAERAKAPEPQDAA